MGLLRDFPREDSDRDAHRNRVTQCYNNFISRPYRIGTVLRPLSVVCRRL